MTKRGIFIFIALIFCFVSLLIGVAIYQSQDYRRDPIVLMNKYYQFKSTRPDIAEESLIILLKQDPNYKPALIEYSQWLLNQKNYRKAIILLRRLHQLCPKCAEYNFQLGYAYHQEGKWVEARAIFDEQIERAPSYWRMKAQDALNAMASFLPLYQHQAEVTLYSPMPQSSPVTQPKPLASNTSVAIPVQNQVDRPKDPALYAMEKAYFYNKRHMNKMAYAYFQQAAKSKNKQLALQAENALTNLVGQQTRSFPDPYYGEIFFMPFSQSHFNLTVNQFIGRIGIEQPNRWQTKEYMFVKRDADNRSENLGQLSQIYEDNVQITGAGVQVSPLPRVPLIGYIEAGAAYDLIYRDRDRWRGDLRGGFMYYQEVGKQAAYYSDLTIMPDYYSTYYADITYFSRYANNIIGTLRTHQGVRAVQYKSSMVNLYLKGRLIQDSQRQFFNNFAEAGPGLGLIPSNRYNIELRFEYLKGVYLPAGGSFNPYSKYYVNKVVQLLCYVKA